MSTDRPPARKTVEKGLDRYMAPVAGSGLRTPAERARSAAWREPTLWSCWFRTSWGSSSATVSYSVDASQPVDDSFPDSVLSDTVICPYNQAELARNLIDTHAHELAAVIVEPVLGSMGMVPATSEFLESLREATARRNRKVCRTHRALARRRPTIQRPARRRLPAS